MRPRQFQGNVRFLPDLGSEAVRSGRPMIGLDNTQAAAVTGLRGSRRIGLAWNMMSQQTRLGTERYPCNVCQDQLTAAGDLGVSSSAAPQPRIDATGASGSVKIPGEDDDHGQ